MRTPGSAPPGPPLGEKKITARVSRAVMVQLRLGVSDLAVHSLACCYQVCPGAACHWIAFGPAAAAAVVVAVVAAAVAVVMAAVAAGRLVFAAFVAAGCRAFFPSVRAAVVVFAESPAAFACWLAIGLFAAP